MRFLVAFFALVFLTDCSSTKSVILPNTAVPRILDDLQVKAAYEAYGMRIDVLRGQKGVGRMSSDGQNDVDVHVERDQPYSYLGVDLGNGLFFDINENLCVDLVRLYGLDEDFRVQSNRSTFSTPVSWEKTGQVFHGHSTWDGTLDSTVEFGTDGLKINNAPFSSGLKLIFEKDGYVFDPGKPFGTGKERIVQRNRSLVSLATDRWRVVFEQKNNQVILDQKVGLKRDGNTLIVTYGGFLSPKVLYFVRTRTGCLFYDSNQRTEVRRDGGVVTVSQTGKPDRVFHILAP